MRRHVLRVHRLERDGDALLPQHVRAYRFVGPVDVSLRIRFFGQQAIHHSGALGFLRVENRLDTNAGLLLEVFQNGFREERSSLT